MDHPVPEPHQPPAERDGNDRETVAAFEEERIVEVTESNGEIVVDEVIDLEVYFHERQRVPLARAYRIRIDKLFYTVDVPKMTARALLLLAGKTPPEKYVLRQIIHGQPVKLELDAVVDFRTPGIEKFKTMLKTAQDGEF
ncbi:MAG: multiubiquitin domain-containing protein [Paracoccaceae bacterium]|nr:multiubiquitin domain-containing protein [Paracoccaceae bacterium]